MLTRQEATGRLTRSTASRYGLMAVLSVAGAAHFVFTDAYAGIVPPFVGHGRAVTQASGVAELACAGLLAGRRTRRAGAWGAAALFVAVFPANVQMALDRGGVWWLRLPLQAPLVLWALAEARPGWISGRRPLR